MNNKSSWQLLEDGPEAYEKYIVPAFIGAWARDIVDRENLRSGDRILDIGCGRRCCTSEGVVQIDRF